MTENIFGRFVLKHNQWKKKKHVNGNESYSDYEVFYGGLIIMFFLTWAFSRSFFTASIFIPLILFILLLIKTDFKKKDKNVIDVQFKEK